MSVVLLLETCSYLMWNSDLFAFPFLGRLFLFCKMRKLDEIIFKVLLLCLEPLRLANTESASLSNYKACVIIVQTALWQWTIFLGSFVCGAFLGAGFTLHRGVLWHSSQGNYFSFFICKNPSVEGSSPWVPSSCSKSQYLHKQCKTNNQSPHLYLLIKPVS